ncbi:NAD(P)-binding protein [Mycena galericulata]|nr:NAD(P)-binding protein [Mycena galericulata]
MTITQDPAAPLIAVVGATGVQGGSVVRALAESDKAYRICGFTRDSDAAKQAAQELVALGVAVVAVSFVVENRDAAYKAFAGADYAFLVTNFWEHLDADREIAEGKLLIDAAKAADVAGILSGGKYTHIWHFDSKAAVTAYGRQAGMPLMDVQAGSYGSNFLRPPFAPVKQADGWFILEFPMRPTTLVPFADIARDYGLFVRYVLELPVFPDGAEFVAYSELISVEELTAQWSPETGNKIVSQQMHYAPTRCVFVFMRIQTRHVTRDCSYYSQTE